MTVPVHIPNDRTLCSREALYIRAVQSCYVRLTPYEDKMHKKCCLLTQSAGKKREEFGCVTKVWPIDR